MIQKNSVLQLLQKRPSPLKSLFEIRNRTFKSTPFLKMDGKWNSRRSAVFALNGMVATGQPLASEVGMSILKKGGNAADAAVAIAAALNIVQPTSTGIGGDAFTLFYNAKDKTVKGINASGRCPRALNLQRLKSLGYTEQHRPSVESAIFVTVPGAPAGWVDTVEKFGSGKLSMGEILAPAIDLAEKGYPVQPVTAFNWKTSESLLKSASPNGGEMLLNGSAPKTGEIMRMPELARSMREIATYGKKGFYEGRIAQCIVDVLRQTGGFMSLDDLADHANTFDVPIQTKYRDVDILECPPNGQGITALMALNILEGFEVSALKHNSAEHLHLVIESLRLAFGDTLFFVADPTFVDVPVKEMLSAEYATQRRAMIKPDKAIPNIKHGHPANVSNTVYFCVVDKEGNACSFINSNYMGFGTGIIPEGCGFTLQNRGANFSLDPNSANKLEPEKRPYHTIIPGMALKNGELFCPFGVMGGFMQPQGHLQVLSNMIDFNMDPQEALDAPRIQIDGGRTAGTIQLEDGITEDVRQKLEAMGHQNPTILKGWDRQNFGVGQIITRNSENGVLCGGSDPRNDGQVIGW